MREYLSPTNLVLPRFAPGLESAYQADLSEEKIRVFVASCLLCAALYLGFGVLDLWAIPSAVAGAWTVRAVVVGLTFYAAWFAAARSSSFIEHYTSITAVLYFIWGLGIQAIISLASPADLAWTSYYAGLMLVSMALYSWTYLSSWLAALIGALLALAYVVLAVGVQDIDGTVLVTNCFFLFSTNIVGIMSLFTRERFSRQAFILKNALKQELKLEEEAKRQSEYLSEHDHLTGLPNRMKFIKTAAEMIAGVTADQPVVGILFLDLDGFKPVNDTLGHAVGDQVLNSVAQRIRASIRSTDVAARHGGDEFVVAMVLPPQYLDIMNRVRNTLRDRIAQPVTAGGHTVTVGASIGMACYPADGREVEALIAAADRHMYEIKRAGKLLRAIP